MKIFCYCLILNSGRTLKLFRINVSNPLRIVDLFQFNEKFFCEICNYLELELYISSRFYNETSIFK